MKDYGYILRRCTAITILPEDMSHPALRTTAVTGAPTYSTMPAVDNSIKRRT